MFTIGSIYDFFTLPGQVREANLRKALYDRTAGQQIIGGADWRYANDAQSRVIKTSEKEQPERVILKLAKENKGILTVSELALGANIPIEEAKKHLETLVSKGFADLRVRKSGSLVYVIPDMLDSNEPLEDF
jgi:predicted transcriptional regulator